ncbi:unnamed protein product [Sphagnum balticum]
MSATGAEARAAVYKVNLNNRGGSWGSRDRKKKKKKKKKRRRSKGAAAARQEVFVAEFRRKSFLSRSAAGFEVGQSWGEALCRLQAQRLKDVRSSGRRS